MLAQAEIMNGARVGKRNRFAITQSLSAKAVKVKTRILAGEEDTKIEHGASCGINFGMGGKWTGIVQPAVEGKLADSLQSLGIKLPGKPLLAEGQRPVAKRIDAHIDWRLEAIAGTIETVLRER